MSELIWHFVLLLTNYFPVFPYLSFYFPQAVFASHSFSYSLSLSHSLKSKSATFQFQLYSLFTSLLSTPFSSFSSLLFFYFNSCRHLPFFLLSSSPSPLLTYCYYLLFSLPFHFYSPLFSLPLLFTTSFLSSYFLNFLFSHSFCLSFPDQLLTLLFMYIQFFLFL